MIIRRNCKLTYYLLIVLTFISCNSDDKIVESVKEATLFEELDPEITGVDFENNIQNFENFNIFSYRNFYNGGGVAIVDINNDNLQDIVLSSNLGSNKLYLNKGNFEFEDISASSGIELNNKWSTGISIVDINSDGYNDIYICNAGYQEGSDQKNSLFINQKDNTFIDEAEKYGLAENGYTTHASFFDYDLDGDLDVYLLNNSFIPVNTLNYNNERNRRAEDWPVADFLKGGGDKFLRNDNGRFVDISAEAGIYGSLIGFGLGVTVGDVNDDNYPDIYVSNDFFEKDYLYINNQKGGFKEELEQRINHISHSSMGADMQDLNNDGHPEIFVTDMLPADDYRLKTTSTFDNINLKKLKVESGFYNQYMHNTLQLNNGNGSFSEISFYSGVAASDWSWGALIFDANNDLKKDLFVCNGIYHDVTDQDFIDFFANDVIQKMVLTGTKEKLDSIVNRMPSKPVRNKFFQNTGSMKFVDKAKDWGFEKETFSNGAAYGDLDNDGDLDLVINNVNQKAQLFKNNSNTDFIGLELSYKSPNSSAIGATSKAYLGNEVYTHEIIPARGFQSSVDTRIIIPLPAGSKCDSIIIEWPNGQRSQWTDLTKNKYHIVNYNDQSFISNNFNSKVNNNFLTEVPNNFDDHVEDDFIDFYYERNIPVQLSKEGPCAAIGDINGDGQDDIFIGGAANQAPQLYISSSGKYKKHQATYFDRFKAFEDTAAEFFDCDGDGDLDLIVGSGGNNITYSSRAFRDRLYINTNGNFEINFNALPPVTLNTSVIKSHDIEGDGDLDLFVGMRSVPGEYGLSPGSFIYINNGKGQFLDVTQEVVPELSLAGMITDAAWVDILPNKGKELILVGEWMGPKILSFDGVKFNIIENEISSLSGWWQSINHLDIDNDGDQDLVLGNIGENFYLQADEDSPLFLWINDFDQNGTVEKIISKRIDGKDKTVFVKRDLIDQLPGLKKQNILHKDFADKTMQDLFPKDALAASTIKKVNYLSSIVAVNLGEGKFRIKKLNDQVQMSSVNAIVTADINQDNFDDLIIAGNNNYLLPQFSAIDACRGKVLINNKEGGFEVYDHDQSGYKVEGVVRENHIYTINNKTYLLSLINNKKPKVHKIN